MQKKLLHRLKEAKAQKKSRLLNGELKMLNAVYIIYMSTIRKWLNNTMCYSLVPIPNVGYPLAYLPLSLKILYYNINLKINFVVGCRTDRLL